MLKKVCLQLSETFNKLKSILRGNFTIEMNFIPDSLRDFGFFFSTNTASGMPAPMQLTMDLSRLDAILRRIRR